MELERDVLVSPTTEVPVVEGEVVLAIRALADCGVGSKAIARAVGVARNTVRRYLRQSIDGGGPGPTRRAAADRRSAPRSADALRRAGGRECGRRAALAGRAWAHGQCPDHRAGGGRTCDASAGWRSSRRCASKRRRATSCKSISAKSACRSPAPRCASSCWSRSSVIPAASSSKPSSMSARMTGARGSPARSRISVGCRAPCSGDNARALVVGRDRGTGTVIFHPTYLAFCRDWDVQPRACAPYRARTKGKTEAGVKFVKRNGLADAGLRLVRGARSAPRRRGWRMADAARARDHP